MPAAAQPEYEFSIDTTTGMPAPPIGMMISTPSTNAIAVMMMNGSHACVMTNRMPKPSIAIASNRLIRCWPAYTTGAPWNSGNLCLPDSLPNAITEPENVIAPTNVPMNSSTRLPYGMGFAATASCGTTPNASGSDTTAYATHTAARPISATVVRIAMAIPTIPNRLPRRPLVGFDRPFSVCMKHADATRYSSVTTFVLIARRRLSSALA